MTIGLSELKKVFLWQLRFHAYTIQFIFICVNLNKYYKGPVFVYVLISANL